LSPRCGEGGTKNGSNTLTRHRRSSNISSLELSLLTLYIITISQFYRDIVPVPTYRTYLYQSMFENCLSRNQSCIVNKTDQLRVMHADDYERIQFDITGEQIEDTEMWSMR